MVPEARPIDIGELPLLRFISGPGHGEPKTNRKHEGLEGYAYEHGPVSVRLCIKICPIRGRSFFLNPQFDWGKPNFNGSALLDICNNTPISLERP
jgi:hypothetical protein